MAAHRFESINPTTEELIAGYSGTSDSEIEQRLTVAHAAFKQFRSFPLAARGALLSKLAELLSQRSRQYAELMAREMGKPLAQGMAEIEKCKDSALYFVSQGEDYLQEIERQTEAQYTATRFEPLGPLLAIMPWNFPFWQVFRFGIPALLAGNAVLLKHAPNTTGCALAIEQLMTEVGFPSGVFQVILASHEQAAKIIADQRVSGVTLTGSTRAGRAVGEVAGRALKKLVLELGGNDPFVVFPDVPLVDVARLGVTARCINSGQSCIAAKRFLVARPILDDFLAYFQEEMKAQRVGDPLEQETTIGPLARSDLREELDAQVKRAVANKFRLIMGGKPPSRKGYFYSPTILLAETNAAPFDEELFGPVATIIPFRDEAEAIRLANNTAYGLGASIWTTDLDRARRIVPQIEAGTVFVNGVVKSDSRVPFGGIKNSGYGRELSEIGIREFVNMKSVSLYSSL